MLMKRERSKIPSKEVITIEQLLSLPSDSLLWLKQWWIPKPGDLYYNKNYTHPQVVTPHLDLSRVRGRFIPLLSVGQLIEIINPSTRPKIFKVTKNAQFYYKNRHNPSVKLKIGWWAVFRRPPHKNAWQHRVYQSRFLVDALFDASKDVFRFKKPRTNVS